jgi:hypothetical protein
VLVFADTAPTFQSASMVIETNVQIEVTPDMLAAGLQVLVDSDVLDRGADLLTPDPSLSFGEGHQLAAP